ncbi:MAG TPA: hypothetical protein VGR56_04135 [Nitrososphaerales archaeon]|nr:hypothetical protein [Nitrososphaerales archaeon]
MSVTIGAKEIPAWTIQQVHLDDQRVLIEAWAREDLEREAIRNACGNLSEGDIVLLEAKDSYSDRRVSGRRRIAWVHLKESVESGRSKLVLQMALHKVAGD